MTENPGTVREVATTAEIRHHVVEHAAIVITIEGSEEGETDDLIYYLEKYKSKLDNPTLVICLDSAAYTKDTISITSSLRGCISFDLKATVAENNIHSGLGGGICPNPFTILTALLARIQDPIT